MKQIIWVLVLLAIPMVYATDFNEKVTVTYNDAWAGDYALQSTAFNAVGDYAYGIIGRATMPDSIVIRPDYMAGVKGIAQQTYGAGVYGINNNGLGGYFVGRYGVGAVAPVTGLLFVGRNTNSMTDNNFKYWVDGKGNIFSKGNLQVDGCIRYNCATGCITIGVCK